MRGESVFKASFWFPQSRKPAGVEARDMSKDYYIYWCFKWNILKTLWKLDIIIYYYFMCTFKKCVHLGTQKSLSGKEPRVGLSSVYRRGNWSSLGKFLEGVTGWNLAEICTGRAAHFFTAELTAQHAVSHRSVIITRKGNARRGQYS